MGRARRTAFSLVLVLAALAGLAVGLPARPVEAAGATGAAAVGWPVSTLLVSEVATGGASASDEFIELANAGPGPVDLAGLEVVYVTSSGSTVTQKASWTASRPLAPGQHFLIANAAGAYAALGDATYTGGLSATGGAIALRADGGATIDAIGWGDATNAFLETRAAPAPPAGSSLERAPGGTAGNGTDTNDNGLDWLVRASPLPQNLASPPTISPIPSVPPTPAPTLSLPPAGSPTASPTPGVCGPTASPPATPIPTPTASGGPVLTPSPTIAPSASPSPSGSSIAIVDARSVPIGGSVRVRGVVTAEAGRLGSAALLAIADETAGIVVHLPAGAIGPARGTLLEVQGTLAAPYGQLEMRPPVGGIVALGPGTPPAQLPVHAAEIGEAVEGGLVAVDVLVDKAPRRESNGTVTLDGRDATAGGRLAIRADASAGIAPADLPRDARVHLVGVVGQRSSRTGNLDGYRIWLRDRADIVVTDPAGGASPSPSSSVTPPPTVVTVSVAQALLSPGVAVRVIGSVTAAGHLLDSNGRVVVIQDGTAAVAVRLPTGFATPRVGARLRVDGSVGRSYDAPRIAATAAAVVGTGATIVPQAIRSSPGAAYEWRLVRLEGVVADVHKLGDRWRAEVAIGSTRILVSGLPDAGLPSSSLVEGRRATVIGIVRRPYPTATDRRFAVVPRSAGDVRLGAPVGPLGAGDPAAGSGTGSDTGSGASGTGGPGSGPTGPLDVDLATLAEHAGETVRVGGIVSAVDAGAILLDDGTAIGRIALQGDAASLLGLLALGDALDAVGRVGGPSGAPEIEVTSAADIVRVGDPGPDAGTLGSAEPAASAEDAHAIAGDGRALASEPDPAGPPLATLLVILVGCACLAGLPLAALGIRRRRGRRAAAGRIALRLAAIAGPRAEDLGPVPGPVEGGA